MAENSLNSDVAAVPWTAAAGASTRETGQEANPRARKPRKRLAAPAPEPAANGGEQPVDSRAHEIDSFA